MMTALDRPTAKQLFGKETLYQIVDYPVEWTADKLDDIRNYEVTDNQRVVILFDQAEKELSVTNHDFLAKILKAVGLSIEKTVLLNLQHDPLQFNFIQQLLDPTHLICFGINQRQLGLNFILKGYQVIHFLNCYLLLSHDLDAVEEDTRMKRALWNCLKNSFSI